ncbi:NADP-dependent 3-hydroxy acid dehydrogenase YdfG [Taibaiella chishuiensis]|uniref:NADP-dependent 3-hydroxy acid dehydrogenase YdfG n=2 Tax=Taibaiella chishuiensis TaxID=1434707 RepID=A0A2P8D2S1_9BACT|nr:NADP-dependent 3-hydroxy acid dehydrogenase YdfG [Taibaiella chishuiensis]
MITGASSGIGKAASLYFAAQGWNVIATMRSPEKETTLAGQDNILVTALDVTDPAAAEAAIKAGIGRFGRIDVLVNNAGYGQQGLFEAITPGKIQAQFDTNVFGLMHVTRAILPHFRAHKSGTVVNVSSGAGRVTTPLLSVYSASKFAVEGFSESLAFELASQQIQVKIVEPGYIATPFYDRAGGEFAADASLEDYQAFSESMTTFFQSFAGGDNLFSAADVAQVIYTAATDGTQQLRYVAGPDIEPMLQLRNGGKADQEYVDYTRKLFMPGAFDHKA